MIRTETGQPEYVVVLVDGPNADNMAAGWGAWHAFNSDAIKLAGIVVSGTCVNYQPDAPLGSRDDVLSDQVQTLHASRMAGLFKRAGSDVPVFVGKPTSQTDITTPIPHSAHVNHDDYDIFGDNTKLGHQAIAGNFDDAQAHFDKLKGKLHVVVGGPFTEAALLLETPSIASKLGHLAAQAGFDISKRAIYSKLAFNVEVDELAALKTLLFYPGSMFNVPSDITRDPRATFPSAEALLRLGIHPELGEIFIRHRARAAERHKEEQLKREARGETFLPYPDLSIHDLQAVIALSQSLGLEEHIFEFGRIDIHQAVQNMLLASRLHKEAGRHRVITPEVVASLGYLGGNQTIKGPVRDRYVVTSQNVGMYKRRVPQLLGAVA